MDVDTLASELLRALRGSRSQVSFSRRLGYRSNVAHTWESGRRWPTAVAVFRAADRLAIDVPSGLAAFSRTLPAALAGLSLASPEGLTALLQDLRRDVPISTLAGRAGCSRFQVSRWLSGRAQPRLPDLLRLVEASTQRLLEFVAVFVDPAALPSAAAEWQRLDAARSLFWRYPHAQLVLLALELQPYQALPAHDDLWLARRLSLPVWEVVSALDQLARTGQIRHDGTRFVPADVATVDTRRHPEAGAALKRWWADTARGHLDDPGAVVSTNAFTVSDEVLQQVIELHRSTFRAMRVLLAAAPGGDRLVLVQHHIVPLDSH